VSTNPLLLLAVIGLPALAESEPDLGLGLYTGTSTQEIQFRRQVSKFDIQPLGLQLVASKDDWSLSGVLQQSNDSERWLSDTSHSQVNYDYTAFELTASYYLDDWSFSLTYGQSDSELEQSEYIARPNLNTDVISEQTGNRFTSDDRFWQATLGYWIEMSRISDNLAATVEASLGYFDSQSRVGRTQVVSQNRHGQLAEQFIDTLEDRNGEPIRFGESVLPSYDSNQGQWQIGVGLSLDYLQTWFDKDWLVSTWVNWDYLMDDDASLTLSHTGRGPNGIRRTISLDDELVFEQQSLLSGGIELSLELTQSLSLSLGLSDSDGASTQTQVSVFYQF